ncbi:MAG: HEAT repeat domain-containing protein, partial [Microcystis aeruginosa]
MIQTPSYTQIAISAIAKKLDDNHPEIRAKAAESLGKIGNNTAVDSLIHHLIIESDLATRQNIIQALG